jgi:hypothetical protein
MEMSDRGSSFATHLLTNDSSCAVSNPFLLLGNRLTHFSRVEDDSGHSYPFLNVLFCSLVALQKENKGGRFTDGVFILYHLRLEWHTSNPNAIYFTLLQEQCFRMLKLLHSKLHCLLKSIF